MRGVLVHGARLLVVAGMIGLGVGQREAQARHTLAVRSGTGQTMAELVYEGRILSIVTDVYNSLNDLGTALTNQNLPGLTTVAAQFSSEQSRLEAVHPVPAPLKPAATQIDRGISGLSQGSHRLITAIQAGNNAASQQAGTLLTTGLKAFETGVNLVHQLSGPVGKPTPPAPDAPASPAPTPIIRGLP